MKKMKAEVFVRCSRCMGDGEEILTGKRLSTLMLLRKQKGEVNGAALAKLAKIETTNMNNRLAWLESVGLAEGRKNGSERLWKAV